MLREYRGVEVMPAALGNRSVYSNAFGRGLSAAEHRPVNAKAMAELRALMAALYPA